MTQLIKPKNTSLSDWHPADIKAALEKKGWSIRRLSAHSGLSPRTLANVIRNPYPKGEQIVAGAIGINAYEIWPSRYGSDGLPNRGRRPRLHLVQSSEVNAPSQRKS